uniref:Short-chain dehydrogenase/reductase family protein n=1 Tax=Mycena chlorophos TaxID=658473 RepID=A0ABQ0M4A3_MYCCL|nr:short-chain dehydrogenase/reductase family protein [Mycena chlorophos]
MALQPRLPPIPSTVTFTGQTVIVTGASAGLGAEVALQLAQRDVGTLILAVRRVGAGESVKAHILADPVVGKRSPPPKILVLELDLDRPSSVTSFANKFLAEFSELHILLLNAGLVGFSLVTTPENGYEQMFQANYAANVMLATRLLPLLRATAKKNGKPSRLTLVGSRAAQMTSFKKKPIQDTEPVFTFMNDKAKFDGLSRYGDSKLLEAMWVAEAAKRIPASEVVINNVCPGMVKTSIHDKRVFVVRMLVRAISAFYARSVSVGARTYLNAVIAGAETHGELLGDMTVVKIGFQESPEGKKMQEKLWKETLEATDDWVGGTVEDAGLNKTA